jgi:hypothetical protein
VNKWLWIIGGMIAVALVAERIEAFESASALE